MSGKPPLTSLQRTPVAIVGMAAIMPQARNLQEYWNNIVEKVDCITDAPPSRWRVEDYYDPDPAAPDKTYCKRGGFIPDIDFDPMAFGLPPNILEVTDVSQLLALLVARSAMEDAGYGEGRAFDRERTGVVLGVGGGQKLIVPLAARLQYPVWEKVLRSRGLSEEEARSISEQIRLGFVGWEEDAFPGLLGNVIAGRIANRLDLGGINAVVDAACASSLSAVKVAVSELVEGRGDLMITGGVDTDNSIFMYMCFSKTPAFSRQGTIRPFDAEADGMLLGEGIGMLVLKRLADAERDNDRVYAVIRGIGSASDGRAKSIYAPRASGQARALRRAYEDAGFPASSVGLTEAHGTGTMMGDPTEFEALKTVFGEDDIRTQRIALGSVKSQVGHTKAAAGAASLIKTALALYHKILPPTLHVDRPHPALEIESSPFYLNTETRPWMRAEADVPRRAGVSAFGFGGTNFHIALEEHRPEPEDGHHRLHRTPETLLWAAETPERLLAACEEALRALREAPADVCVAATVRAVDGDVPADFARAGCVAASAAEACDHLEIIVRALRADPAAESWDHPKGIWFRRSAFPGKVAALFPGQGSQYPDMGRELALNFPAFRRAFTDLDGLFTAEGLTPLSQVVYPEPAFDPGRKQAQSEALQRTSYAQPAVGAFSAAAFDILRVAGFSPDFTAGHSFGELTALWAAGAMDDGDYFALVRARGQAMSPPEDPGFDAGAMLAVQGEVARVMAEIQAVAGVEAVNLNAPDQVVLAGPTGAVLGAQAALTVRGFTAIRLPVSAAFHTPLVAHAAAPFGRAVEAVKFRRPRLPVFSNGTGRAYPGGVPAIRQTLREHLLKPVLFQQQVENLYAHGVRIFVEVGPGGVLTQLVKAILADRPHIAVAVNASRKKDSDRQFREAVVRLRVAGLALKDFDPYRAAPVPPRQRSSLNVRLNGSNYVSEKTRTAFEDALSNGPQNAMPLNAPTPPTYGDRLQDGGRTTTQQQENLAVSADGLAQGLAQLRGLQSEPLRVHEQFLKNQLEYARIFAELTRLAASPGQTQELTQVLRQFQEHQAETLRVHEHYLNAVTEHTRTFFELLRPGAIPASGPLPAAAAVAVPPPVHPVVSLAAPPSVETVAPSPPAPVEDRTSGLGVETLTRTLLEVVSEKTGYPEDVIDMDMDIEADLGIDSIKRVEILGALQNRHPGLPPIKPEQLAELRTLRQVVAFASASVVASRPGKGQVDSSDAPVLRRSVRLKPLPDPDHLTFDPPDGHLCLITDDGRVAPDLARALVDRGWRVAVLSFPRSLIPAGRPLNGDIFHTVLEGVDEAHLQAGLAGIEGQHGPVGAFIHLHPGHSDHTEDLFPEVEKALVKGVFLLAKHLQPALTRAPDRPCFLTVVRMDGAFGLGRQNGHDAVGGGLFGLTKSLGQEWPSVFCRAVDIGPDVDAAGAVRAILAELHDPNRLVAEVAYGPQGRSTLVGGP